MIRIGRYFDRDPSDPSGLTFEEWLPELAFTPDDVGSSLTITAAGSVKVENHVRTQIFWDDIQPPVLSKVTISKVTDEWVTYGKGKRDRFRNVRVAGSFVVNSTELRAVNFSMEVLDRTAVQPRTGGRRAAVVTAPKPKRFRMHREVDAENRARCW